MNKKFVVLGAGIAGLSAAETIRKNLPEAEITMITEEPQPAYIRPLLSKFSFSVLPSNELLYVHPLDWYKKMRIKLYTGMMLTSMDKDTHEIHMHSCASIDDKESVVNTEEIIISYDKLIYALGSKPFIPPYNHIPAGVFSVRTINDIYNIRRYLSIAHNAVVIGGGVIGLEIALKLKKVCPSITVFELAQKLMSRQLDTESAELLQNTLKQQGIEVFTGVSITDFENNSFGRVSAVKLADGRSFPADLVIISAGVVGQKQIAEAAGIECGKKGVIADIHMRTSDPDVYAAGDCVSCPIMNPCLWVFSKESGKVAGFNACDPKELAIFDTASSDIIINDECLALFSTGLVSDEEGVMQEKTITHPDYMRFRVNRNNSSEMNYKKCFYKDGKMVGAVLMGNLSEFKNLKNQIEGVSQR